MAPRDSEFIRLNLAKVGMTDLLLRWRYEANRAGAVAQSTAELGDPTAFMSITDYRRSGIAHALFERLIVSEVNDEVDVIIGYVADGDLPRSRVPSDMRRTGELLSRLITFDEEIVVECQAKFSFSYGSGAKTPLWFPLPVPVGYGTKEEDPPLTEIRGIRGVKLNHAGASPAGTVEYTVLIDRPDNDSVYATVDFAIRSRVSADMPLRALDQSVTIAERLGLSLEDAS